MVEQRNCGARGLDTVPGVAPPAVDAMVTPADGDERNPEEEGQSDVNPGNNLDCFNLEGAEVTEQEGKSAKVKLEREEGERKERPTLWHSDTPPPRPIPPHRTTPP